MTSALVLAAKKSDPRDYKTNVDVFQGICEAAELICTLYNILRELYQLKRYSYTYIHGYNHFIMQTITLGTRKIISLIILIIWILVQFCLYSL